MPILITQDTFEPELLLNPNLTLAIPAFATLPDAQIPKKKFKQFTFPLKLKLSKFRGIIMDLHKSIATYKEPTPRPMETRKRPRPLNPKRRLENQNILPFTMGKMTAKRVFNWSRVCTSRN
jgi:hypothetical protein